VGLPGIRPHPFSAFHRVKVLMIEIALYITTTDGDVISINLTANHPRATHLNGTRQGYIQVADAQKPLANLS
jgi:hypothetical protein